MAFTPFVASVTDVVPDKDRWRDDHDRDPKDGEARGDVGFFLIRRATQP
jgi:hypothetical protein